MAKYQNMLVAIDLIRTISRHYDVLYLHQRIGGKIKAFCRSMTSRMR